MPLPPFSLEKWYFDLTDGSQTWIIYYANLAWGPLRVHWSSTLHARPAHPPTTRTSLAKSPPPQLSDSCVSWQHPSLSLHLRHQIIHRCDPITLFQSDDGTATWHCVAPLATVEIACDGQHHRGLGYVERLHLTIPPWKLPLHTLRWGRFTHADHSLTWIEWQGDHPLHRILLDGQLVQANAVSDDAVRASGASLEINRLQTLRQGPIAGTLLSSIPGLLSALPAGIGHITEAKWLSRGVMHLPSHAPLDGQVIHETIHFGRNHD